MKSRVLKIQKFLKNSVVIGIFLLANAAGTAEEINMNNIDERSFRLGGVSSFSEMVKVGLKKLALSAAMLPAELDEIEAEIRAIAKSEGIEAYREEDLIVTDLFPADVAKGKHVMLLYRGNTLEEYLALKKEKAELVDRGAYQGAARKEIAMKFGRLLSYPQSYLEQKLR